MKPVWSLTIKIYCVSKSLGMRTNQSSLCDEHKLGKGLMELFMLVCFQPEGSEQSFTQTLFLEFDPMKTSLSREVEFHFPSAAVPGSLRAQVTAVGMSAPWTLFFLLRCSSLLWFYWQIQKQFTYKIKVHTRGWVSVKQKFVNRPLFSIFVLHFIYLSIFFLLLAAESEMKQSNRVAAKIGFFLSNF